MEFQIAEAIELIKTLAETENLTQSQALTAFVAEAGLDLEYASLLKAALFEEYTLSEMASDTMTKALYNVFVSGQTGSEDIQEVEEKETQEGTKYKVRVKDRASGSSYVRYATREKIAELRANPNISSVELTDHGDSGEDDRGDRTAAAKRGDYDGDGKKESSSKEHAGVVHNAIQRKMGGTPDGQDTRREAFDPKGARRMDAAKGKKKETQDEINKRLMLGKYSPAVKYAKTRKEDVEYVDEVSKELATKAYAERRTNEFEADQLHTKSDKTRERIVKKHGEKAGKDADKAAEKKIYGEGIDFKGARRIDDARKKERDEKEKKSPSSKDYRLAMGKFRPGASREERAEGGRDVMREKGTSPTKKGKKMFEAYLELREARAKTREEARKKLDAHQKAMKSGGESPYFGKTNKDAKDPWSTHASDAKAHSKEDKLKEGWKPDPTEKRARKAEKLSKDEAIEAGRRPRDRDESKIDKLYKRRQAVQSKTKMRKEDYLPEADLVDAGRENQTQRDRKKLDGKDIDNSMNIKLMPKIDESVVTESGSPKSADRLAESGKNTELRAKIKEMAVQEECCPKCGTPECTCESKETKKGKKKVKIDEAGMPIIETAQESRNNRRPGPSKEMIDPPADPQGPEGHMNPKGEPKRYKEPGEAPGDRRPNRKKDKSLPNEDGTVPNGSGV